MDVYNVSTDFESYNRYSIPLSNECVHDCTAFTGWKNPPTGDTACICAAGYDFDDYSICTACSELHNFCSLCSNNVCTTCWAGYSGTPCVRS